MSDPQVEIEALCEVHRGSGRLVLRREGDRIVLDGHADECCVIALEGAAVTRIDSRRPAGPAPAQCWAHFPPD